MGLRVDNITDIERRVMDRLMVIAGAGDGPGFKARYMAGEAGAAEKLANAVNKYGAAIDAEERAKG